MGAGRVLQDQSSGMDTEVLGALVDLGGWGLAPEFGKLRGPGGWEALRGGGGRGRG